jgi:hypothetical protein
MTKQCGDCRFWHDSGDCENGECRIRAPLMRAQLFHRVDDLPMEDACWPWVTAWHWCGKFSPQPIRLPNEDATDGQ